MFDPSKQAKLGFAPKQVAAEIAEGFNTREVAMICYCSGKVTENSAQCVLSCFYSCKKEEESENELMVCLCNEPWKVDVR